MRRVDWSFVMVFLTAVMAFALPFLLANALVEWLVRVVLER
jgi:hypothetical protein